MSRTLKLIDRLLAIGRNLHKLQRDREALHCFGRLAAFGKLPPDVAEEAQFHLADIHLRQHRYRRGRRHLSIALLYRPDSARYHHLMASALEKGRERDLERAASHYEKALDLDAEAPRCLADYGRLCVRLGRVEDGLGALTRAVDLAPNDPLIVVRLVRGLERAGRSDEALSVLRAARFRNPRDGRFRQLYHKFLFRRLHRDQQQQRQPANAWMDEDRPLLPFVRVDAEPIVPQDVRQDAPQPLPGPHRRRPSRRTDWKHG